MTMLSCNNADVPRSRSQMVEFLLIIPPKEDLSGVPGVVQPSIPGNCTCAPIGVVDLNQELARRLREGFRVDELSDIFSADQDELLFTTMLETDKGHWIWYLDSRCLSEQDVVLKVLCGTSQRFTGRVNERKLGTPISLKPGRYLVTITQRGNIGSVSIEAFGVRQQGHTYKVDFFQ